MSAAQSASAEGGRLRLTLDSCGGVPRNSKKTYAYYMSFSTPTSAEVKSRAQPVSAQDAVVWKEKLYLDFTPSSNLDIVLYEKHRLRGDQVVAKSTVPVSELSDKDEVLLPVLDDKSGAVCALRLTVAAVKDGDHAEMDDAVAAVASSSSDTRTGGVMSKLEDPVAIGTNVVSSVGVWEPLFEKIQVVADIAGAVAEVHPYTKVAWGVISAGYELAKKQKERDENVAKLIEALCNAYDMVLGTDGLEQQRAAQTKAVTALIKTTISCGHAVETYLKRGFWGRAFQGLVSSVDKEMNDFLAQFEQLQQNLTTFTAISTQHHVQAILGSTERIEDAVHLNRMPFTPAAQWRTGRKCLPGTRKEMTSQVLDWAHLSSDETPRVLLLTGVAGVGKSSIANTVASDLQDMGCLAASYCFDRNNMKEHRPELLIPTIAHQLASAYPVYQHALASNSPSALGTPDLDDQFDNLLLNPLKEQTFAEPLFVVIDALDESGNFENRAKLVSVLAERFVELPSQVRLILTSRPEEDVLSMFGDSEHAQIIHLDTNGNDEDIKAFVASKLVDRRGKPLSEFSSADYAAIAAKAEGLFQWAAVVCASITQGKNPNFRATSKQTRATYERFISLRSGALDALYDETLARLFPEPSEDDQLLARILGSIVSSQQPLSATSLFELLQISEDDQESCFVMLQSLSALLTGVSDQDEPIRTIHSSFRDYLFEIDRGQRFHTEQSLLHRDIVLGCLCVLNEKLRFNMCGLETSYIANRDVPDLAQKLSENVPPSLSYAAQSWGYHIEHIDANPLGLDDELGVFLREKFLFWLELLSLIGAVNVAAPALGASRTHIAAEYLREMATDYRRFVRAFGQAISRAAPHVYLSAYAFAPVAALVHQQSYSEQMRNLPKLCGMSDSWSRLDISINAHTDAVTSVAFSPNGRHIVSGSLDHSVRIWDAETGTAVGHPIGYHTDAIYSVNYSPDGRRIVSGSRDSTVRIWDAETGDAIGAPLEGHTGAVSSVAYSLDSRWIVSGSSDRTVRIWNAETGAALGTPLEGHTAAIHSVSYSPDVRHIVSGSHDATIRIWDAKTGAAIGAPLEGHTGGVHSVAYSPDSRCIVSSSEDCTVRIWDVETRSEAFAPLQGHTAAVFAVAYSPDGHHIVSGAVDSTVRIWDAKTGAAIGTPLESHASYICAVAYSPDGHSIVSGSGDQTVRVWDAQARAAVDAHATSHTNAIWSVTYSPDGRRLVSGSQDKTLRIWNTETGAPIGAPLKGHTDIIRSVAYSPDGRRIASSSNDKTVRIWDAETGDAVGAPLEGHTDIVNSVAYSPNGCRIVSGSDDMTVRIWNAETGAAVGTPLEGHRALIYSVAYSPDSLRIISGSSDQTIIIWDAETGAVIGAPLKGHTKVVQSVMYSPDGKYIASGSWDRTVRIWDAKTGVAVGSPFKGHTDWVTSVAYSPDGHFIVSGSSDATVRIWSAETGAAIGAPLEGHAGGVYSVMYSPDGRHIVSGAADATVRIWDAESSNWEAQTCMFSLDKQHALQNHPCTQSSPSSDEVDLPSPLFRLTDSGWIEDVSCSPPRLLLWIPAECRTSLYLPRTLQIIPLSSSYQLDLSSFVHGTRWTECYSDGKQ